MARRIYEFVKEIGTSFGWFPEVTGKDECETCVIVDMIAIAILLAESVDEGCWNDVERFLRNHLVESQMVDTAWIERVPKTGTSPCGWRGCPSFREGDDTACRHLCFREANDLDILWGLSPGGAIRTISSKKGIICSSTAAARTPWMLSTTPGTTRPRGREEPSK